MGRYGVAASWPAARLAAHAAVRPLPPERRPLDRCGGTALASPLVARSALPAFDTAAMDGWAVAGPGPWRVVGEVRAGSVPAAQLALGTAVVIATGASVPDGAHAVLPVEIGSVAGDLLTGDVDAGRHVRRAGEECAAGEELLPAGTAVTAAVLGLAAACGQDELAVVPRPRVRAVVTGDELLAAGLPGGGRVRDALGPQLRLLVEHAGGELLSAQRVRDEPDLLRDALDGPGDLLLTTGATSVGAADHLRALLREQGAEVLVDGVACRPGHPQLLARLPDGRLLVGLPGNPLAALVAAVTLLAPALAGLGGRPLPALRRARLAGNVRAAADGTRLVPVRLAAGVAEQVRHTGAGMLRGAALADALAVVPPGPALPAGAEVELVELP